ncbi:hypothetical protein WHT83_03480 [Aminobacter sp. P9b]|uniref:Uncharacterized protein n=1 Tax=Aminobacter niigataensis TaxID=83265 RepID=A0ABR6L4E8_9HYPH|nr:hypothetical protein [Aminobacter niigataensis]MBB4651679.1 hypothetical protein [Aminobacter niigataensis]
MPLPRPSLSWVRPLPRCATAGCLRHNPAIIAGDEEHVALRGEAGLQAERVKGFVEDLRATLSSSASTLGWSLRISMGGIVLFTFSS